MAWKQSKNVEKWLKEKDIEAIKSCPMHGNQRENRNSMWKSKRESKKVCKEVKHEKHDKRRSVGTKSNRSSSVAASVTSGRSSKSPKQKRWEIEAELDRKNTTQRRRATVMMTSGALTFVLLAATLVTATFLMSPVIEKVFGNLIILF